MRFMHFDRWGQPKGDGTLHGVITAKRSRGTDGTDTLTLTLAGDTVEQGDMIAYHDSRGRLCEHSVGVPETVRADAIPVTTVTCDSSLAELQLKGIPYLKTTGGAQGMLATILDGTRWTLGTVQANGATTATIELKDSNTLAALQEIANTFDLEITTERAMSADRMRITGRTVHLKARSGDITGRRVSYGKDLKEIRRTLSATRPITRLYVYGKSAAGVDEGTDGRATISSVNDGKPYLDADPTLLDLYGRPGPDGEMLPADGFVEYSDIDDPNELLRLGKGELAKRSQPKVTYEASATTLQKAGMGVDGIDLGDTIQVVDTTFPTPLRLEARVLKIEEDLLDDAGATSLTFGNITDTLTSQSKKVQNTVQKLWSGSGAWDDAANLSGGYLDGVIAGINTQMNKTGGYTYLIPGEGLYVYDKPKREDGSDRDATMAIQIGGGYFRIANSRKTDGTWNWRTMGTGAGLVADVIIAGMLRGGSSWWNLDTGEVQFEDGIIRSADNGTYWNLSTGEFRTDGTIDGGTIRGTDIEAATITGGTINASKLNAPTVNGGTIDQSDITSQSGSQKATMTNGVIEFYRNGGKVGEISAASGGMNIEYGNGYGITMSDGGTSIEDNSGSSIHLGTGGFSVVDPSRNRIELGTSGCSILSDSASLSMGESGVALGGGGDSQLDLGTSGLSITTSYGTLRMGSGGLNFTNDQGWGLSLSASGWSIEWAGGHRLATGPEAGALYIDGNRINTGGGTTASTTQATTPSDQPATQTTTKKE